MSSYESALYPNHIGKTTTDIYMSRVLKNVKILKMGVDKVIARFPYHTSKESNIFKDTPQHTLQENMLYLTRYFPFYYFETPLKVEQPPKAQ